MNILLAMGREVAAQKLLSLEHPREHSPAVVQAIHQQLRDYFFIGGMPEAVATRTAHTQSKLETHEVHSQLLGLLPRRFLRSTVRPLIEPVWMVSSRPPAGRSARQIVYTRLYEHATSKTNHKAFDLLCRAKLLKPNRLRQSVRPAARYASQSRRFKASVLDIGLMQHLCGMDPSQAIGGENLLSIYRGQLAEQFVAQELLAWHGEELYYWSRLAKGAAAEVDYLTVCDGQIYPIEVKSGPAGKLRSLHLCLETYPNCPAGWVVQDGPYQELPDQKLIFWPLYATPLLGNRRRLSTT